MKKFKGGKILVVEDNIMSYKLFTAYFKNSNLELLHAEDGQEAVNAFKEHPDVDLILMDIQLPVLNGLEVTKQIRKLNSIVPIIATTANVFEDEKEACRTAGCNHFISKPINFIELFDVLDKYLD
jgi:CheY-like chemotaxis protein